MFDYSRQVTWIQVDDVNGNSAWVHLASVECVYGNTDGTTTFCLKGRSVRSTMPFDKVPDMLGGTASEIH